ncbi:ATP-binding protein [Embleya sp. NPDC059237]|uniref:ATP-binding protein n=1 Tax=Embleya sp. NPDC059237 TaxID=3346784 RepID=UPI003682623B
MELPAQRLELPRTALSAKSARLHTDAVCAAVGALSDDDPRSVVVELVTNALEHTDGSIDLFWWVDGERLLFAVTDDTFVVLAWRAPRAEPDADAEDGRGLEMALVLADEVAYGPCPGGGKWIRAAFALPASSAPETLAARRRAALGRPIWHDAPPAASYRCDADDGATRQAGPPSIAVSGLPVMRGGPHNRRAVAVAQPWLMRVRELFRTQSQAHRRGGAGPRVATSRCRARFVRRCVSPSWPQPPTAGHADRLCPERGPQSVLPARRRRRRPVSA